MTEKEKPTDVGFPLPGFNHHSRRQEMPFDYLKVKPVSQGH